MATAKTVKQRIPSQPTSDGDGVKIQRIAAFNNAATSPFLMLDELKSDESRDYIGGFPPHPHRGIETFTYMMTGHFQHRDHLGNVGELRDGGAQWMAAGRGVIHSEMPIMTDGQLHGFQIWINQPAKDKMKPAKYHDFQPEVMTEFTNDKVGLLRVLAGNITADEQVLSGPLQEIAVETILADWRADPSQTITLTVPSNHNTMLYVYAGTLVVSGTEIHSGELAILNEGDTVTLTAQSNVGSLLLSGEPLNEPVVHYGPFVMNSIEEIQQTIEDFNNGVFETY
ncbi:pirin family protein [Vibrio palustris]|uniref:Quercetin 2,3-dioxygenase n=1 Tax=Vibrio palustris TaxID=1918946 RepID=A0A1R4B5H2_9VIBR|nr:pirin family protein [Vibrio palustris]SJL84160.1 Quercetin 2,3-dioxygenase [Vibrio palustris]